MKNAKDDHDEEHPVLFKEQKSSLLSKMSVSHSVPSDEGKVVRYFYKSCSRDLSGSLDQ